MLGNQQPRQVISFGPFQADLQTQELSKQGIRLRLPGQSFQVLRMLLDRPGRLVTRKELQAALWPSETYVDFDRGVNAAVNRLRDVLGDSADNPHLIETLPRRGYRFVGHVVLPGEDVKKKSVDGWKARAFKLFYRKTLLATACLIVVAAVSFSWFRPTLPPPKVVRYRQLTNDGRVKDTSCVGISDIAADASRVYFPEWNSALWQVSTTGGDSVSVPTPFGCVLVADISPNKTELLLIHRGQGMEAEQPFWLLSLPSGAARRLGDLIGHAGTWSPDGLRIVYANGHDLYVAHSDGTDSRKLLSLKKGTAVHIRWAPDGKVLRFTVQYEPNVYPGISIWEIAADGTNLHPLFPGWTEHPEQFVGEWTPDGKFFLFGSPQELGPIGHIWAMREKQDVFHKENRQPAQLTSGPRSFWFPVPSTDNKHIFAIGSQNRGEVIRYNLKSGELLPFLSGISAEFLDFSRDGSWVTYVTYPEGILWRSRLDGSQGIQLTASPLEAAAPRWSPDGKRIVFMGRAPRKDWKIYLIPDNGGTPEALTHTALSEGDPTWSPDGNSLVFGETSPSDQPPHVYTLDLETRRTSTLPGSEGLFSPRWSPDGRFIVALGAREERKTALFDIRSQKWTVLVRGHDLGYPVWSKDSKYIHLFDILGRQTLVCYRVSISDHKLEQLASFDIPKGLGEGPFGPWEGLAPDGSPLFMRDLSLSEIYALDLALP